MKTLPMVCTAQKGSRAIFYGYLFMAVILGTSIISGVVWGSEDSPTFDASTRLMTEKELSSFDGKDGRPAYAAYNGKIYDFTNSPLWKNGEHPGKIRAGMAYESDALEKAPHGEEVLQAFKVVGVLEGSAAVSEDGSVAPTTPGLMIFLGKTLTAWTGYLLGIAFVLNFFSCCVMPWRTHLLPFKGKRPGHDAWDEQGFLRLTSIHTPVAWATIVLGTIHGVLGIFQSFGIYI